MLRVKVRYKENVTLSIRLFPSREFLELHYIACKGSSFIGEQILNLP